MTAPLRNVEMFEPFSRWVNDNRNLDSYQFCLTWTDIDGMMVSFRSDRVCLLLVEWKSNGSSAKRWQEKVHGFLDAILHRSHGLTIRLPREMPRRCCYHGRLFLQFQNTTPDDSDWMRCNGRPITREKLEQRLQLTNCLPALEEQAA